MCTFKIYVIQRGRLTIATLGQACGVEWNTSALLRSLRLVQLSGASRHSYARRDWGIEYEWGAVAALRCPQLTHLTNDT